MSITGCLQEQQPGQMRLAKALSWHYPNREYINSLLLEKKQRELEYAILRLRLGSSKLDGVDDNDKCENLRIRLSRLNSLNSTKTNAGSIHTAFREHEQEFHKQLDHDLSYKTSTVCSNQFNSRPVRLDFISRHLRAFLSASEDSLKVAFNAVVETIEQGYWKPIGKEGASAREAQGKSSRPKRTKSSSPGSRIAVPEMADVTSNPARTPRRPPHANAWEEPGAPKIPAGLTDQETGIYRKLIRVRKSRIVETPRAIPPPRVVVITDLGKDYDDLAAMVVLKELHRIGLIELVGFITNLHPSQERAKFGRGCLDSLGLVGVPLAWGEEAQADASRRKQPEEYEFPKKNDYFSSIYAEDAIFTPYDEDRSSQTEKVEIESGVRLLDRLVYERIQPRSNCQPAKGPLTFLLISGLADIATYAKREPENLAKATKNAVLQGNYSIQQGPVSYNAILTPDLKAANNDFDKRAAIEWHQYMDNHHIPSVVYTKTAASNARLPPTVFNMLRDTEHPVGQHLRAIQRTQDLHYYSNACDPEKRYKPDLDQNWFLRTKTNWYQTYPDDDPKDSTTKPAGEEVLKYVELVCYDALAALGTAGNDVLEALHLLEPREHFENQGPHIHKIVGIAEAKDKNGVVVRAEIPGINPESMRLALTALLKGSLMAVQEGIPSTHTSGEMWTDANTLAAESTAAGTGNRP